MTAAVAPVAPDAVLRFWLEECSPADWYTQDDALDAKIRDRFGATLDQTLPLSQPLSQWRTTPEGTLALLILTDQFPRNMFRGTARAFATDNLARAVTKWAISRGFDRRIEGTARQFFYLPLEHSEVIPDQERAVRLIAMWGEAPQTLLHARAHRAIIRRFGRFPFRNAALGRMTSPAEQVFIDDGGYGAILRDLQAG
ncbi:DUF924 family protein [Jannaschia helgolandensis]|uniref:DUF924 family protein n=1 Tax=Jannaschia helgolandensis TaxID=188906 RepID=UPI0030DA87B9